MQLRSEAALRALVTQLGEEEAPVQNPCERAHDEEAVRKFMDQITTLTILQLAATYLQGADITALMRSCLSITGCFTSGQAPAESTQSIRQQLRGLARSSYAKVHRFVASTGTRM